ncbi:RNA polymerase sigma-70 factor (ECF subfamily) [Actinoalloteichus hymeniacidonis]|nr:sigma factor-like helix-turn-helix DNA-binding protein [Actinoalloteichus hymeniacidonis]MBB5909955.1 RNA polymerase sigma-70 factor (ECF subfamily) [Actinoalloteichus hymeniacidonis]
MHRIRRPPPAERAAAFTEAYHRLYPRVLAFMLRRVGDRGVAEDLASKVFQIGWEHVDSRLLWTNAWFFGTARTVLAEHHHRAPRLAELHRRPAVEFGRPPATGDDLRALAALDALDSLTEEQREVLLLHYWEGLDSVEVAYALRRSRSAIWLRLYRARRAFRAAYLSRSGSW